MAESLKHQAIKGVVWSAVERFSVQGIQFVLSIVIARLVAPSEYGLIAMLGIFLAIAQAFIDSGFSTALVQKKDRTEIDYSTVFYFNLVIAIIVYGALFLVSPYIATFYKEPKLELVTKWVGLNLIISGLSIVQRAKLTIKLDFKTQAKASLIAVLLSGVIGVILAYKGFGVWALVIQALLNNLLDTLLLWIYAKWRPLLIFSWRSFRILFSFGSKLLLSVLLHTIYLNLYSLVIGRRYSSADVGYYNRASSFAQFPSVNLSLIVTRAIYPVLCKMQDDEKELMKSFVQAIRISCILIFPLMVGLAVLAKPFILLFLTEKWIMAVEPLIILCLAYMWFPIMYLNNQILNVKGRSDYYLKAEIIKKIVAIIILVTTMPLGINILCWGILIYNVIDMFIIIMFSRRIINVGFYIQIKTVFPVFAMAACMGGIVLITTFFFHSNVLKLLIGVTVGVLAYLILGLCFYRENMFKVFPCLKRKKD